MNRFNIAFTLCGFAALREKKRREVLGRLLALNHERYAEEVAAGLHEKGKGSRKDAKAQREKTGKNAKDEGAGQLELFG